MTSRSGDNIFDHLRGEWFDSAVERGQTDHGRSDLRREADDAELELDAARAAALRVAAARGRSRQAVAEDAARLVPGSRARTLGKVDIERVRADFGVADEQIRRDHAISHVLAALSVMPVSHDLIFFGGTALSRTYLPTLRLSEDIDLITTGDRRAVAQAIEVGVARALRRTHGVVEWKPHLVDVRETEPAALSTASGVGVRVQLLTRTGYPQWPTRKVALIQRYRDAADAALTTYTPQAFAASKLNAWLDRHAARDLYDMWGLAEHGYIDRDSAELFARYGTTGGPPAAWMFDRSIAAGQWVDALAHQGRIAIDAATALDEVRAAWLAAAEHMT